MSLALRNVQLDCRADRFDAAVGFWAAALGARPVAVDGPFVHLHDARSVVEVHLQRLHEGQGRVHLDLAADDVDAEAARLQALGASVVGEPEPGILVLRDPAGLVLCVVAGSAPSDPLAPDSPGGGVLDSLFVDVLDEDVDTEVAFWAAALGAQVGPVEDGTWTPLRGVHVPGGALTFEVQRVGPGGVAPAPRHHVDLRADDIPAEAARLESLGARRIAEVEGCITLVDPADHLLCVIGPHDEGGPA